MIKPADISMALFGEALQVLRHIADGRCENFTSGIGACYDYGRSPGARYSSERCCDACIAHRFLTCHEVPQPEEKVIDHV